jgi:hypothetical protein
MLYDNAMLWRPADPLALSSGAGARLALAALVAAGLWAGVAWATLLP